MKKLVLASLVTLTSASFAGTADTSKSAKEPVIVPPAPESDAGFFIGAEAGVFQLDSLHTGSPVRFDFKFKQGTDYNVPFGYDFGNGFSAMLSVGRDDAVYKEVTLQEAGILEPARTNGHMEFMPLMASASYSVKIVGNLSWYIGGGLGAVHEKASWNAYDHNPSRTARFRNINFNPLPGLNATYLTGMTVNDWEFGFEAFSGLSYKLSPHASIEVGYRYLNVDSHIGASTTYGGPAQHSSNLQGQTVQGGLIWKF